MAEHSEETAFCPRIDSAQRSGCYPEDCIHTVEKAFAAYLPPSSAEAAYPGDHLLFADGILLLVLVIPPQNRTLSTFFSCSGRYKISRSAIMRRLGSG